MLLIVSYIVIILSVIGVMRMSLFLIGADLYRLSQSFQKKYQKKRFPAFSVIIPAHNEETTILRAVDSIFKSDYLLNRIQLIVVDDGSTDGTAQMVKSYVRAHKKDQNKPKLVLVRTKNQGKANALNTAMKNFATGKFVVCLDSDSYLDSKAIGQMAIHFRNEKVVAIASNVKVIRENNLLNLIQRFEYLVGHQSRGAQTVFNFNYIIGGVGSAFRKNILDKVGYYDGDTITEDIDLTLKIVQLGNKKHRIIYASDVIAYTEGVMTLKELITQRSRWKWGRCQTFLKNKNLFFSPKRKFSKTLTWFYLPFVVFSDFICLLEPLLLLYLFYIVINYRDFLTLISSFLLISFYLSLNIWSEDNLSLKEKALYCYIAPSMYIFFYILEYVEYVAVVKSLINLPKLKASLNSNDCQWEHVSRTGTKSN